MIQIVVGSVRTDDKSRKLWLVANASRASAEACVVNTERENDVDSPHEMDMCHILVQSPQSIYSTNVQHHSNSTGCRFGFPKCLHASVFTISPLLYTKFFSKGCVLKTLRDKDLTQHNIADLDCFKTLILQETLKTRSQHQGDSYAFSEVTRSCRQFGCARTRLLYHTVLQKLKLFSLDASSRMDGISPLTLWDLVIEVFHSSPNQTKTKDVREPRRNLSATPQSNM